MNEELTTYESLSNDEVEESTLDTQSDESIEQETAAETSTDIETSTTIEITTSTGVPVDAVAVNRFVNTGYAFISLLLVIIACKGLYRLFKIIF